MEYEFIALLKSLAYRPSPNVAPSIRPMVDVLELGGYVVKTPSGWTATAKGCEALEADRRTRGTRGQG
jgi:hypothetical protein